MKILRRPEDWDGGGPALAIGNFDGVHRGHQAILEALRLQGEALEAPTMVLTFRPHPAVVLGGGPGPPRLASVERRRELLAAQGVDALLEHPFDEALAALDPAAFARSVLQEGLGARCVVVGEAFRFGRGRAGDVSELEALGRGFGFDVVAVPALRDEGGEVISATRIRRILAEGGVERAARLLGRPHALTGRVLEGAGRGRDLGFPTANLEPDEGLLLPALGVYAGRCAWDARTAEAVVNIGLRPTFGDLETPAVEAHLLDFEGELVGRRMILHLVARLRGERRFRGPEDLVDQIRRDVETARATLGSGESIE